MFPKSSDANAISRSKCLLHSRFNTNISHSRRFVALLLFQGGCKWLTTRTVNLNGNIFIQSYNSTIDCNRSYVSAASSSAAYIPPSFSHSLSRRKPHQQPHHWQYHQMRPFSSHPWTSQSSTSLTSNGDDYQDPSNNRRLRIAVLGGGASGMFAATAAAESIRDTNTEVSITVFESSKRTMTKVKISGGGRCNVLHDTSKPVREILNNYPRGKKEITGLLTKRFTPQMAQRWFEDRGVQLKTEKDGRMFPTTDDSQTIIDAVMESAMAAGVEVCTKHRVAKIDVRPANEDKNDDMLNEKSTTKFVLHVVDTDRKKSAEVAAPTDTGVMDGKKSGKVAQLMEFDALILATGSSPEGHEFAKSMGHTIINPVPSLFTMRLANDVKEGGMLYDLSGLSVPEATVAFRFQVPGQKSKRSIKQTGPLLITHHGISGPAPLKLSAFAAREFHNENYRGTLHINFASEIGNGSDIEQVLQNESSDPTLNRKRVFTGCQSLQHREIDYEDYDVETGLFRETRTRLIPRRLWINLCRHNGITDKMRWVDLSKKTITALTSTIVACPMEITGKNTYKEEFVTAGGIKLSQIDMTTLGSRITPGLFCCGEVMDVDGVTGGYNFMNCWGSGFVAGTSAVQYVKQIHNNHVESI